MRRSSGRSLPIGGRALRLTLPLVYARRLDIIHFVLLIRLVRLWQILEPLEVLHLVVDGSFELLLPIFQGILVLAKMELLSINRRMRWLLAGKHGTLRLLNLLKHGQILLLLDGLGLVQGVVPNTKSFVNL